MPADRFTIEDEYRRALIEFARRPQRRERDNAKLAAAAIATVLLAITTAAFYALVRFGLAPLVWG